MENEYTSEKLVLSAILMPNFFTIGRNLAKFWQKISLHSFFLDTVYVVASYRRSLLMITANLCIKLPTAVQWNKMAFRQASTVIPVVMPKYNWVLILSERSFFLKFFCGLCVPVDI